MRAFFLLFPLLMASASALAAAKTYQVTGTVVALTDSVITLEKNKETWEINRASAAKLPEGTKVGSTVTIHYSMAAAAFEDKTPAPPAPPPAVAEAKKPEAATPAAPAAPVAAPAKAVASAASAPAEKKPVAAPAKPKHKRAAHKAAASPKKPTPKKHPNHKKS